MFGVNYISIVNIMQTIHGREDNITIMSQTTPIITCPIKLNLVPFKNEQNLGNGLWVQFILKYYNKIGTTPFMKTPIFYILIFIYTLVPIFG